MKNTMKRVLLVLTLTTSQMALAFGPAGESPLLYFEMGGGEPIREPLSVKTLPHVNVGFEFTVPNACDLWDLKHADQDLDRYFTMVENYIEGEIDELGQTILNSVVAYAEGLLAAAVQRAMPGMYDYAQNVNAQLSADIEVGKESCETVVAKIEEGNSPINDWKDASKLEAWKNALGVSINVDGSVDVAGSSDNIIEAEKEVAKDDGNTSVPWFGGDKGGSGAEPIKLIEDTVKAGYALQSGSAATEAESSDTQTIQYKNPARGDVTKRNRLGELWGSSGEAVNWANKVVGERLVSFCSGCGSSMQGGAGLLAAYYDERTSLEQSWAALLKKGGRPTIADMNSVSAGNVHLTVHVYDALMSMIPQDRAVYIDRLVADAAVSATAEKAMALRRIIRTAETTPEVSAYPHVKEEMVAVKNDLKAELDEMAWEISMQNNLTSNAAASLVSYHEASKKMSLQIPVGFGTQQASPGTVEIGTDRPVLRE